MRVPECAEREALERHFGDENRGENDVAHSQNAFDLVGVVGIVHLQNRSNSFEQTCSQPMRSQCE